MVEKPSVAGSVERSDEIVRSAAPMASSCKRRKVACVACRHVHVAWSIRVHPGSIGFSPERTPVRNQGEKAKIRFHVWGKEDPSEGVLCGGTQDGISGMNATDR